MKLLKIILFMIFAQIIVLFAQSDAVKGGEKKDKTPEIIKYKISPQYNVNISHKYIFRDSSVVSRVLSDNTTSNYKRNLQLYTTLRAPSAPKNQIINLICGIDSMLYEYNDGVATAKYDSQDDESTPPFKYYDFQKYFISMGKEFDLTISSYNEPVELKSEQIESIFFKMNDEIGGMKDTLNRFTWERVLSLDNLKFFVDVNKGITPDNKVAVDSTWIDVVHLVIDGVYFKDSVQFKLNSYNTKEFLITGKSLSMSAIPIKARFQGINRIVDVTEGSGTADYKMTLTNRGVVSLLEINSDANFKALVGKDEFKQNVKSKFSWKLDKLYKW